jgi:hypothetical protein
VGLHDDKHQAVPQTVNCSPPGVEIGSGST